MNILSDKSSILPTHENSNSKNAHRNRFLTLAGGVFAIYLIYGYIQELIFTLKGISAWYLTLVQFFYYTIFGLISNWKRLNSRRVPIKTYCLLAFLTLGTISLSNSSLEYLNFPTQVMFKSCKLIPVLIGGILIQKKKFSLLDVLAAVCMCTGLLFFTLADCKVHPKFNFVGVLLICSALLFDAAIGNVQEKAMRDYNIKNFSEMVLYSYGIGFFYLLISMLVTGTFSSGFSFFWQVWSSLLI